MKVVCAPDKFKGSLRADQAAQAMAAGVLRACPTADVDLCPVADGGEGFVAAMAAALEASFHTSVVQGPLGSPVEAVWALAPARGGEPATAIIEMAAASGLQLTPTELRDPTRTSTFGTGQLIAHALDAGAQRMVLGIGGSATCDGGAGMAQALGVRFYRDNGLITQAMSGGLLAQVQRFEMGRLDPRVRRLDCRVACDVSNPLIGPQGAAAVYGPQKGATPAQVQLLERGLAHWAQLIEAQLGVAIASMPGAGAAGGLGGGLVAFLAARLEPGVELVLDAVRFEQRSRQADLCLTGEGSLDAQTLAGKVCSGVALAAAKQGVPTVALVGQADDDAKALLREHGGPLAAYHVIAPDLPVQESLLRAAALLEEAACQTVLHWINR